MPAFLGQYGWIIIGAALIFLGLLVKGRARETGNDHVLTRAVNRECRELLKQLKDGEGFGGERDVEDLLPACANYIAKTDGLDEQLRVSVTKLTEVVRAMVDTDQIAGTSTPDLKATAITEAQNIVRIYQGSKPGSPGH